MKIININDIIYATAEAFGSVRISIRISGINSVNQIINAIKREVGAFTGMINITLRNMTQGWSQQKSIYLM